MASAMHGSGEATVEISSRRDANPLGKPEDLTRPLRKDQSVVLSATLRPMSVGRGLLKEAECFEKHSSGVCLLREVHSKGAIDGSTDMTRSVLVCRRWLNDFYELPKGHVEMNESLGEAGLRELREETGLRSEVEIGRLLSRLQYVVPTPRGLRCSTCEGLPQHASPGTIEGNNCSSHGSDAWCPGTEFNGHIEEVQGIRKGCAVCKVWRKWKAPKLVKYVSFFIGRTTEEPDFGPREGGTKEVIWIDAELIHSFKWKNEDLKAMLLTALDTGFY